MPVTPYLHKIQFYETDQMGIVHHANFIHWFEEARVDYMEQVGFGYQRAVEKEIDFAVLGVSCDYLSMMRFGETARIEMSIPLLTPVRMTVAYKIYGQESGKLCAAGESRHCYYHGRKKRPVSLKKELPELYQMFGRFQAGSLPEDGDD